jgi:hypothetical protein
MAQWICPQAELVSRDGGPNAKGLSGAQEKVEGLLTKAEFMSSPLTGAELEVSHLPPLPPNSLRPILGSRQSYGLCGPQGSYNVLND